MPPKNDPGEPTAVADAKGNVTNVTVQNFGDKKIKKKFEGGTALAYTQWKLVANQCLERIRSPDQKLWAVMDALEGRALAEIQRHKSDDRDTAEKVLDLLDAKYSDRRTATQIRCQFYALSQAPGQSVMEFADKIVESLQGAEKKLVCDLAMLDAMMRDQFAENVLDAMLRWELRKAAQETDASFDDVRAVALDWESGQKGKPASSRHTTGSYAAESSGQSEELATLRQMVAQQQLQIQSLTEKHIELMEVVQRNSQQGQGHFQGHQGQGHQGQGYQGQGHQGGGQRDSRACFYCGKPGHIAARCFKKRRDENQNQGGSGGFSQQPPNMQFQNQEGNGPSLPRPQQGKS